jgi:uncharacterized protein with GYD domain
MPTYVTLMRFTEQEFATSRRSRPSGSGEEGVPVRRCGDQGLLPGLGRYDAIAVIEGPNDEVAARLALAISSQGHADRTFWCSTRQSTGSSSPLSLIGRRGHAALRVVPEVLRSSAWPPTTNSTELERLRAENARLKKTASKGVSLKVSEKGGVSVYGLGRFPVTLYKEQWTKLLDMADDIRGFIRDNEVSLKAKES